MTLIHEPGAFRAACTDARRQGKRVALVPTMGALHRGHMGLVARAHAIADWVAVSFFVNPAQFGPGEDLDCYPRTLEADRARCDAAGVAVVFAPESRVMYPEGDETRVNVGPTAAHLCGAFRPGHFEGVCTIVAKLFALTGSCVAVFGRKDYQQWRVIERFARDLHLPVEVVAVPTVREADGLALSSRNRYLSEQARSDALAIPRALSRAVRSFDSGERSVDGLRATVRGMVEPVADKIDYVELADADSAQPLPSGALVADRALLAVAAHFGGARLIDNVVLGDDPAPLAGESI